MVHGHGYLLNSLEFVWRDMARPKLVEAEWAKGKYDTYRLCQYGSFEGYMHPPGVAYLADTNPKSYVDVDMVFLSSRNQQCRGKWHICAASVVPFASHAPHSTIICNLILLLGVESFKSRPPRIQFHYYRWRNTLGKHHSLNQAMKACRTPIKLFEETITTADHGKIHIRFLNQISGRVFKQWKHKFECASLYGSLWHEIGPGPNQWMLSGNVNPSDSNIKIIQGVQVTCNREGFNVTGSESCGDTYNGTKNVMQLDKDDTMVIYTTRRRHIKDFSEYMWVPLPNSPPQYQDFALIYQCQKNDVDNWFANQGG